MSRWAFKQCTLRRTVANVKTFFYLNDEWFVIKLLALIKIGSGNYIHIMVAKFPILKFYTIRFPKCRNSREKKACRITYTILTD